ncbi:ParB N-terminal domain-containing protein [Rhizorhabdus wittichii]|uniref:Methyltransferase n=1 Tax=Rhizorhabdus wittichii TaxID=160791 RepID=A0A975HDW0_9SPHN|nr:DNA methyltransferase [Rhizorhabdus wittichii]QTH20144.1 ParB N-terminal domain-containing protein [Rhizorhabdus wittichii]
MTALEIIYRPPTSLSAHSRNARRHSARQISQLKASIKSFGFNVPVIINPESEILAGHGRVQAATELKLSQIPTVTVSHMTPMQARAFMLADNQLGDLSTWDSVLLADELEELAAADEAFEITDTGFELARIDVLIEEKHKPKPEVDIADTPVDPATVERVSRLGDLWLLGRHRLFVGSALDPLSYQVLLGSERAQMIFADAPFNVRIKGNVSGLGKAKHDEFVMGSGEMSDDEFRNFLRTVFENLVAFSTDGSIHFQCIDWRGVGIMLNAGEVYTEVKNIICWVKAQGGMGSLYRSQHELVVVFKSGTAPHINNIELGKHGRNRTNVWTMAGMNSFGKGRAEKLAMHPTVKPVALVAEAILDCSTRGGLVLDVFSGSGTTIIAAERTGRTAAVMELDPKYADVTLRRFCDVTGIEPVNAWTGRIVKRRSNSGDAQ